MNSNFLSKNWINYPLGKICKLVYGKNLPVSKFTKDGYPVFGANGIIGKYNFYIYEKPQVLISCRGAYSGKINLAPAKSFITNNSIVCEINSEICSHMYLYYVLQSLNKAGLVSGSAQPQVTVKDAINLKVPIAPFHEQTRIVSKIEELFSNLDEAEKILKHTQKLLEQYKQSVLKAAVIGELTKEWREANKDQLESGEEFLQRILKARRDKWQGKGKYKEPKMPDISKISYILPEEWHMATIEQLSNSVDYGSSAKCNLEQNGIPVLRMGNIIDGQLNLDNLKYLSANHEEFPKLFLRKGDLLFNRTNSADLVGKTAIYNEELKECSYASYLIRVRFTEIESEFIAAYINSMYGRNWIAKVVSQQVGQANVNGTKLKMLTVPLPPIKEQNEIVQQISNIFSKINFLKNYCQTELNRIATLRQSILKAAFSGKLVPQDPNDEPAEELLKRIKNEAKSGDKS